MSNTNNGGPAFPQPDMSADVDVIQGHPGMTLRDYFAAKAMSAYIATYPCPGLEYNEPQPAACDIAADAYAMANAMLSARESE